MSPRRAFTLIELLIVISIIALLMGMLIVAIPNVIYNAKALKTAARIDAVLQGLSRVGQQEGSASMIMQRDACMGGVYQFDTAGGYMLPTPAVPGPPAAPGVLPSPHPPNNFFTNVDLQKPYIFGFPWGKNDLICPGSTPAAAADPGCVAGKTSLPSNAAAFYNISTTTIDQLDVQNPYSDAGGQQHLTSIALMEMADILPPDDPLTTTIDESQDAYLNDRSSERAWNDAWGNPLVIAWGIFQPGGNWPGFGSNATAYNDPTQNIAGSYCAEAWRQYQYNRSVYVGVASAGPAPYDVRAGTLVDPSRYKDATLADWGGATGILQQIWDEATTVCQGRTAFGVANPAGDWGSDAFDRPPWQGVTKAKAKINGVTLRCQLSQPHEFK